MVTNSEVRFKRFLHYGDEGPLYQSRDRILLKHFKKVSITSMDALIKEKKAEECVFHIDKAFSDGYFAHPEYIILSLAYFVRQELPNDLRGRAYKIVKTFCKSPKNFFVFVKLFTDLAPTDHSGWGKGCRRVCNEWYMNQSPMELAECVTRFRGRYFWTHKDVMKLCHPSTEDMAMQAVLKYVVRGLPEACKEFASVPEAQDVLSYIKSVEDFKHCQEEDKLARLIEQHKLSLEHVPAASMRFQEVWVALIPLLPFRVLLEHIPRLGRMRFLQMSHPVFERLVEALAKKEAIMNENIYPAKVLIILRTYKRSGRSKFVKPIRTQEPLPPPNKRIIELLEQLLDVSFKVLVPTGLRYLVAVDTQTSMQANRCYQSNALLPLHAAALVALGLVKAEQDVTVLAFQADSPSPVPLHKDMSLKEAEDMLRKIEGIVFDIASPLTWARTNRKSVDVFVVLTTTIEKGAEKEVWEELKGYRSELNLPNAKFVVCGLSSDKFNIASEDDPYMFDIAGFDEKVPRLIEAFSRGAF